MAAQGDGLRLGDDLLAAAQRMEQGRGLGQGASKASEASARSRPDRLVPRRGGLLLGAGGKRGAQTGPNPTDRRKAGSKHHVLVDAKGIPLAVILTGANRHDVTQLIPLVDAIPAIGGKPGPARRKFDLILGDRAYDSSAHRIQL